MLYTEYDKVTPGYYWARYEDDAGIPDPWILVRVDGYPPFLRVHLGNEEALVRKDVVTRFMDDLPLKAYDKKQLFFYNRVNGPEEES